jgi:glycosyltransferase
MKLSLVTVSFNSCSTLKETIASVRAQKQVDVEYIVVDGGSTDGTVALLESSGDVVTHWISEPDKGIYDAMNKGLQLATGDVVGFLHSDDQFASEFVLSKVLNHFHNNDTDFLYGDLEYVSSNDSQRVIRYWKSGIYRHGILARGWMPPHPTVYFRKWLADQNGGFDTAFAIAADYEWMLRVLKTPGLKIGYLPEVMVRMRTGGASNRNMKNILRKSKEDYLAIKKHLNRGVSTLLMKNFGKLFQFIGRQ